MKNVLFFLVPAIIFISTWANPCELEASPISGTLPDGVQEVILIRSETDDASSRIVSSDQSSFRLRSPGKKNMLGFVDSNGLVHPALMGVKVGRRVLPVQKAIDKGLCTSDKAVGLTVLKGAIKKATFLVRKSGADNSYVSLSKLKRARLSNGRRKPFKRHLDLKSTVRINDDCSTLGNGANRGIGAFGTVTSQAAFPGDKDFDGMPDLIDSDDDGDGVLNPFDPDFTPLFKSFYVFSNLKVDLPSVLNSNAISRPKKKELDDLLKENSTLAIEVLGDDSKGEIAELDCNGLSYCSNSGTGTAVEGGASFPGAPGGSLDGDGDGKGTLLKGSTGDFQLMTGAGQNEINAGDSFIETVEKSDGSIEQFFSKLDFVYKGTPALKSVTVHPGEAEESTETFSYPVSEGDTGTAGNCLFLPPIGSTTQKIRIVAWRPQRKGLSALGEAEFVDMGGSELTIDIPNKPCPGSSSSCTENRSTGICSVSTYSEDDPFLDISSGKLVDTKGDANEDPDQTLSFEVDLKACLAETGDSLDLNEQVFIDVQFRSNSQSGGSDNAAVKFCIVVPSTG